jgi:thiaminase
LANFREHIEGQNISQEKINLTNQLVREQLEKYILTPANSMFSSLFLLNLYDDNLSVSQFREFLLENERHLSSLANFQEHIKGQSINQDKINLTNQLVRAQLEKSLFFINLYDNKFSISKFRKFMLENEEYPINLAYWWKHARKRLLRRQDICQEKIILVDQLVEKSNATAEK